MLKVNPKKHGHCLKQHPDPLFSGWYATPKSIPKGAFCLQHLLLSVEEATWELAGDLWKTSSSGGNLIHSCADPLCNSIPCKSWGQLASKSAFDELFWEGAFPAFDCSSNRKKARSLGPPPLHDGAPPRPCPLSIIICPTDSNILPLAKQTKADSLCCNARVCNPKKSHTVDGRNPAPPKNPWIDDSPVNTNKWFPMVSKWCRSLSIHSRFCSVHIP